MKIEPGEWRSNIYNQNQNANIFSIYGSTGPRIIIIVRMYKRIRVPSEYPIFSRFRILNPTSTRPKVTEGGLLSSHLELGLRWAHASSACANELRLLILDCCLQMNYFIFETLSLQKSVFQKSGLELHSTPFFLCDPSDAGHDFIAHKLFSRSDPLARADGARFDEQWLELSLLL